MVSGVNAFCVCLEMFKEVQLFAASLKTLMAISYKLMGVCLGFTDWAQ